MKKWMKRAPFFIIFAIAGSFALGSIIMVLWNSIVPAVFHAGTITLLQAVGLFVLARLLFGGIRKGGGRQCKHGGGRHRSEKWQGADRQEHATETTNLQYVANWQMRYNPESAL